MSRQMYWDEEAHQFFPVDDVPQEPVKPTNADRMRSMTDEELAKFITSGYYQPHCPVGSCPVVEDCEDCWLRWLKKEVE